MTITKPAVGSTGWNTAADAVIDRVNALPVHAAVDYGVVADNTTDDGPAIQNALTAAATLGGEVQLPPGFIRMTTAVTVPAKVTLRGAGRNATVIRWPSATGDAVTLAGTGAGIRDLNIENTHGTPTSGALLVLDSGAYSLVSNMQISGGYDNLRCDDSYGWTLDHCYIVSPVRYGAFLQSIVSPDTGDSVIRSCTFDTSTPTVGTAIRYESGGGLKMGTTKVLHHAYGIDLAVSDGSATSVFLVTGCSVEDQGTACIRLGRAGTTGTHTEVAVVGCQINGGAAATGVLVRAGVEDVSVTGCTLKGDSAATAIDVDNLQRVVIGGNSFRGWNKGVVKGASTPRVVVGTNNYGDVAIPLTDEAPSNLPNPGHTARAHTARVSTTSTAVYEVPYRVEFANYRGALIDLTIEGLLGGVGNATRHVRLIAKRDTGNVAVTNVSDTAAGAVVDVQYDVTTTAGSLLIGVRRNSGAGGTQIDATVTLSVEGGARLIEIL